jgi:hypothetical protein
MNEGVTVLCPECGEVVEVKDPAALIRALHLMNACTVRALLSKEEER